MIAEKCHHNARVFNRQLIQFEIGVANHNELSELGYNPSPAEEGSFYQSKIETAEFFISRILPQSVGHLACLTQGAKPVMQMAEARF